ncbi:MAG: glycoside hydrolase family 15 protein [Methylovirgula sp.]|nr:glycoside hydrolase family 15 protein [Methylovirgula sp.]
MQTLELAAIGNCAIASLIDRGGRHVWFCFPRLDGDPVFSALVNGDDPQQGFMDVVVCDAVEANQRYLPNTAVLETTITDRHGGQARIIDFAPRAQRFGRSFHPPLLVRRIEPVTKRVRLAVRIRPHFNYGATKPAISFGSNHVRYGGGQMALRVTADMAIAYILEEAEFALDRPVNLFIGPDESVPEAPDSLAQNFLSATIEDWRAWVRGLSIPFEWQQEVIRSAITLKLCSCEDTGAIVAALTTSIPEAPHTARNWDYRFCWLRDAFFTVGALNRLGATRTMENFIRFIIDAVLRENDIAIAPLYPISSGTSSEERFAPSLSGYQGMGPVRIGNAAVSQIQNDVYGSIILTAAQMFWDTRLTYKGLATLYRQLRGMGDFAARHALTPDAGPWEYRGRSNIHTYSAAMCWAALHRLALIAERVGESAEAATWEAQATKLRAEILDRATTPEGWLSGVLDTPVTDATCLLLPEIGFLPANDPRIGKTLDIIAQRLMRDGFVMRYNEADDFGHPETAFLVCTFWYADALAFAGRRDEAREIFKNALSVRNTAGLLSEDVLTGTRMLWGNFPQAYSHVGLIHSAARLSRGWEEALWRAS